MLALLRRFALLTLFVPLAVAAQQLKPVAQVEGIS
jgi:hypothetical protein